uniref:Uncharacterized protein n=1 Tax=Anopheles albimanus TaxID=7167 RepID=A0A182FY39_ANOAL
MEQTAGNPRYLQIKHNVHIKKGRMVIKRGV